MDIIQSIHFKQSFLCQVCRVFCLNPLKQIPEVPIEHNKPSFKNRSNSLQDVVFCLFFLSGNTATQIDFVLFRKSLRKLVMDVKVIPGEEVALQHQLLVCDMMIDMPPQIKRKFTPHPKVWKLRDPQTCS